MLGTVCQPPLSEMFNYCPEWAQSHSGSPLFCPPPHLHFLAIPFFPFKSRGQEEEIHWRQFTPFSDFRQSHGWTSHGCNGPSPASIFERDHTHNTSSYKALLICHCTVPFRGMWSTLEEQRSCCRGTSCSSQHCAVRYNIRQVWKPLPISELPRQPLITAPHCLKCTAFACSAVVCSSLIQKPSERWFFD